ncbi:serine-rich coiled-coil domain-containing protein 2 isoform X3 [Silurus meridionalis]|uniref:serine-rich coiled-coil domain-containing protein 2 isoform X3 n=1 Tax=Silurus meridionalis TaxID=175797 RepID=UPI001EECBBA7|nr:serine-rich coiled-coil domain-containing protein 2 isoform X3 [Silurus meridionalis]
MEDTTLKQPTMVSRLPKFGSRATPAAGPITNGSSNNVSAGWAKAAPAGKPNGIIRVAATFPVKGRKGREECGEKVSDSGDETRAVLHSQQQPRSAVTVRQIRKPSASPLGKTQSSIPNIPSTIPRTITQTIKTNPCHSAPKQPPPIKPLCSKLGVNAAAACQGSPSSLQGSLSHSSDSLKSLSMENAVRSQSFSYLKRPAAATDPPLTRSFSFNRATELAKELPRPLAQSPIAKSPVTQASMVLDRVAKTTIATCTISSMPSSTMKKSLLPNCTDGKPSSVSYKLMRPSLIKQPRQVLPVKVQGKMDLSERVQECQEKSNNVSEPSRNTHSAGTTPEEPFSNMEASTSRGQSLEILEDMSLSSTSSLERNDVSEEYMDDFDDLGNGGGILFLPVHEGKNAHIGLFKEHNTLIGQCQERSLHSFVSETVDWDDIGLDGSNAVADALDRCGTQALCAESDLPHGSSLELSPSDSSGGTYMWDEEVLEPIGRPTQLCGSFDSNLNSMDILNNLDNLDSCDLEEDDLMLDVDLPEDVSLQSDVDQSERNFWPWIKRQQCRGRTEQLHCEERERDGDLGVYGNSHTLGLSVRESGHLFLDELILRHMTQDCTSVKEQLFHLRTLLQIEEDGSVGETEPSVSSPSSEEPSDQQAAKVQVTPCICQQGELQRQEHQDKSTQTPWRAQNDFPPPLSEADAAGDGSSVCAAPLQTESGGVSALLHRYSVPQILQPFQPKASNHYKLARSSHQTLSEALSDPSVDVQPGDGPVKPQSCTVVLPDSASCNATLPPSVPSTAPAVSATAASLSSNTLNSDNLLLLLNTRLQINEPHNPRVQFSNCVPLRRTNPQSRDLQTFSRDKKAPVLIKTRGGEQVSLGRGVQGAFVSNPGFSGPSKTRHLPPPSRGLPCISSVSQSSLTPSPHSSGFRTSSAPRDEISSGRSKDPSNACNSRLPKPKSH